MSGGDKIQVNNAYQVQKLLENDISSDDDIPVPAQMRMSPVIAPMAFGKTQTQLKRRYFSTGAKRTGQDGLKDPVSEQQNEINNLLFAHKNAQKVLNSEMPQNLFKNTHNKQQDNKHNNIDINSDAKPPVVTELIREISNSDTLNTGGLQRKLVRTKRFSGNPINKDKLYAEPPIHTSRSQADSTKFMLTTHINSLLNDTYDETEPIEPPLTTRRPSTLKEGEEKDGAIVEQLIEPVSTQSRTNVTKTLTRTKNTQNIIQKTLADPFNATVIHTATSPTIKTASPGDAFKYKELQSTAQFIQISAESAAVQKAFKDQFRKMQAGMEVEANNNKKLTQAQKLIRGQNNQIQGTQKNPEKQLTTTLRSTVPRKTALMKSYNKEVTDDMINLLSQLDDWKQCDRGLREICTICAEQPNVLPEFADPGDIFKHCPRLLVDLRSALVTSTLHTLHILFQTYTHTSYLMANQSFIIQLLRKAGNPSLQDFMEQQADQALLDALRNCLCGLNNQNSSIQQLLQAFQLESLLPGATPGTRFRVFYFIADLLLFASQGAESSAALLGPLIQQTESRYSLCWTDNGLSWEGGAYQATGEPNQTRQRLAKQVNKIEDYVKQVVAKYCSDAHPEVRRSARRLYFIAKILGIHTTANEKADSVIKREGVADTWWGRS